MSMPNPAPRVVLICVALLGSLAVPAGAESFEFKAQPGSGLEGKQAGPDRFVLAGIEEECEEGYFEGTYYRRTLELVPIYGDCIAKELGGLYSTFILYGCAYLVRAEGRVEKKERWEADVDLSCRYNYSLRWQVYELYNGPQPMCTTKMYPQTDIGTAVLSNMDGSPGSLTIRWDLDELEFEAFGVALLCGIPEGVVETGPSYTGHTRVHAIDSLERPTSLAVVE